MIIALAQIDMRLGDLEGICSRIESQARLAHERGARMLLVPAPLMTGSLPSGLIEDGNFEHALISSLADLARRLDELDMVSIIPALVAFEGVPLFEAYLLKGGRVIPLRGAYARHEGDARDNPWAPPVFDIDGVRMAVTFDALRDIELLPAGCDILLYFMAFPFELNQEATAAVASVADGYFSHEVSRAGVWLACMAPVGGYDETVFPGGSFVMDDAGRVVAAAPCFEEGLLVQEIRRGEVLPALGDHELPHYRREEWCWEALRLHLRDTVHALGFDDAVVLLTGDLPSSLTAALAVDALGSRRVHGLLIERSDVFTPRQEEEERARLARVRELARNLGIRLVERSQVSPELVLDGDGPQSQPMSGFVRRRIEGLCFEAVARGLDACALSSMTKTDAALAAPMLAGGFLGAVAPFGDIWLTALEFIAKARASVAIPQQLVSLRETTRCSNRIVADALAGAAGFGEYGERIRQELAELEPAQIDGVLEAHVERGLSYEEIPLSASRPTAVSILLMLVSRAEPARRTLPMVPCVSGRSFAERAWPATLAWSDTGRGGVERLSHDELVDHELKRMSRSRAEAGNRIRGELAAMISGIFGISPEQLEDDQGMEDLEKQVRRALEELFEGADGEDGDSQNAQGRKRFGILPPGAVPPGMLRHEDMGQGAPSQGDAAPGGMPLAPHHGFSFFSLN